MCTPSQGTMLPYGLKIPSAFFPFGPTANGGGLTQAHISALDFQRSQINDYNIRLQLGLRNYQNSLGLPPFHSYIGDPYAQAYFYQRDPRARFVQEEPKPSHSYIGLIGMAILQSKDKKLVLSDIYQWILDNYPYFRTRGPGWRNSIRHNLSLNDCFIKSGRSANGKGHYWAVHPANVDDFERGDFRRRRAQRKVRRHMGLSVPDDDDSPTPSPSQPWGQHDTGADSDRDPSEPNLSPNVASMRLDLGGKDPDNILYRHSDPIYTPAAAQTRKPSRKRLFDMASLLAPDDDDDRSSKQDTETTKVQSAFMFQPIPEIKIDNNTKTDSLSTGDTTVSERNDLCVNQQYLETERRNRLNLSENYTYDDSDDDDNCDIDIDDNEEIRVASPGTLSTQLTEGHMSFVANKYDHSFFQSHRKIVDAIEKVQQSPTRLDRRSTELEDDGEPMKENAIDLSCGASSSLSPASSPLVKSFGTTPPQTKTDLGDEKQRSDMTTTHDPNLHTPSLNNEHNITEDRHVKDEPNLRFLNQERIVSYNQESLEMNKSHDNLSESEQLLNRKMPSDGQMSVSVGSNQRHNAIFHISQRDVHSLQRDDTSQLHHYKNTELKLSSGHLKSIEQAGLRHFSGESLSRASTSCITNKMPSLELCSGASTTLRHTSEQLSWSFGGSKTLPPKDRVSAFSSLDIRQHAGLYSQTRLPHNLMHGFPVSQGQQQLLLPVSSQARLKGSMQSTLQGTPLYDSSYSPGLKPTEMSGGQKHE